MGIHSPDGGLKKNAAWQDAAEKKKAPAVRPPYKPETRDYAIYLYQQRGWGYTRISKELGCSTTTVRRWVQPWYDEAQRQASRIRKQKMVGVCEECGGETKYNGHKNRYSSTSRICARCARANQRYWTREKIIEAIQRWTREHGKAPTSTQWKHRGEYWPSATAIYSHPESAIFSSWNEALRAAGVKLNRPKGSPGPGRHWWPREEARVLWEQGWSAEQIAAKYGVTANAIANVFGYRTTRADRRPKALGKRTREQRIADLQKALANQVDG